MTPERHAKLSNLFLQARRLPPNERDSFVADATPNDQELRDRVRDMLREDDSSLAALDTPPVRLSLDFVESVEATATAHDPIEIPEQIGPYAIRGLVGVGGMSIVYRGWQADPGREVAIKVLRPSMMTADALRRFRFEAQTQARLNHPGIVPIFDADVSTTAEGQTPYFVMELIAGVPITEFVNRNTLSVEERIKLLQRACEAVQYAHQRGVLHRDLKPSNILVDKSGRAQIVDFGVARVLDSSAALQQTRMTQAGNLIGTLAYMSPEQIRGAIDEIDTRSDLYALGVIAYEVLTGSRPYTLEAGNFAQNIAAITDESPQSLRSQNALLSHDVELVIHKALAKVPAQRYASVSEFADDLRRAVAREPITARKPSLAYVTRRFVQRNRGLASMIAIASLTMVIGVAAVTWGLWRVSAQQRETAAALTRAIAAEEVAEQRLEEVATARDRAEQAAKLSSAASKFLMSVLSHANPDDDPDRALAMRGILAEAEEKIRDGRFADAPLVQGSLLRTVGRALMNLEQLDDAERNLRDAIALYEEHDANQTARILSTHGELSRVLRQRGDFAAAAELAERTYELQVAASGAGHERTLRLANRLGIYFTDLGRYEEAADTLHAAIATAQESLPPTHSLQGSLQQNLARLLSMTGDYAAAEEAVKTALEIAEANGRLRHPRTVSLHHLLGSSRLRRSDFTGARSAYETAEQIAREAYGPDHSRTLDARMNLALVLVYLGEYERAIEMMQSVHELRVANFGADHPAVFDTKARLGTAYREAGDAANAIAWTRAAYDGAAVQLGAAHPTTLKYAINLSRALTINDESDAAIELLAETEEVAADLGNSYLSLRINEAKTAALMRTGDFAAAEPLARATLAAIAEERGTESWEYAAAQLKLARCLAALDDIDQAQNLTREACPKLTKVFSAAHPYVIDCENFRATLFAGDKEHFTYKALTCVACAPASDRLARSTKPQAAAPPPP